VVGLLGSLCRTWIVLAAGRRTACNLLEHRGLHGFGELASLRSSVRKVMGLLVAPKVLWAPALMRQILLQQAFGQDQQQQRHLAPSSSPVRLPYQ